jgi:hypothetical protein
MGDIPQSVKLKLRRVDEHMNALDESIKAFLEPKPYGARRILERDGAEHVFVWDGYIEPPDDFGLIAGDAIHNLRSSLDHLALALAIAGASTKGVSMTQKKVARIQFPVVASPSEFAEQLRRGRLEYVEPAVQAFIEDSQPYRMTPKAPKANNLFVLSALDNADKHRVLTTAGLASSIMKIDWPPALEQTPLQNPQPPVSYKDGAEICRFVFPTPQREVDVPVEFVWGFTLLIGATWHTHDIRNIITNYISTVRWIVFTASTNFIGPFGVLPTNSD